MTGKEVSGKAAKRADGVVTIGVFGHYGNRNLGDEAIVQAVVEGVREHWPTARIYGFSMSPVDTEARYGIPAFPVRRLDHVPRAPQTASASAVSMERQNVFKEMAKRIWPARVLYNGVRGLLCLPGRIVREARFLRASYARLREVDLLLISGSNQLLDNFGGVLGFPYTLFKWAILAKVSGTKLAFLSVGAGPIRSPVSSLLFRTALLLSDYNSFRDIASKQLIETTGFRELGDVYPDLAHGIAWSAGGAHPSADKRITVGINPMPVYDGRYWPMPDDHRYRDYVGRLAKFASILLREGYRVFFFPTQSRDENVIQDVLRTLDDDVRAGIDRNAAVRAGESVAELMNVYRAADIVVATRFHGVLLALRAARPVLGICYFRKTRDLLRDVGQEHYAVELETFGVSDLLARFKALEANRASVAATIHARGAEYRSALRVQYQNVFRLLDAGQA